jgi:hypothetical protein
MVLYGDLLASRLSGRSVDELCALALAVQTKVRAASTQTLGGSRGIQDRT